MWHLSSERLDIVKDYCSYGLEHWGSDSRGVEMTRHFLLNWIRCRRNIHSSFFSPPTDPFHRDSFLHRYYPVGIVDEIPGAHHLQLDLRPPTLFFRGRTDLETLLASPSVTDWVKISEMFLGPAPKNYTFQPKYDKFFFKIVGIFIYSLFIRHRANAYSESFIM